MCSFFDISARRLRRILPWALIVLPAASPDPSLAERSIRQISADRTFERTVDEGTWMSVDVSPDSSTVIFDLLGDLYTVPMEGGKATALTSGPAFESMPTYSPDGSRIAYVSDVDGSENLWIARADGSEPEKLSDSRGHDFITPRFTPSGDRVLVARGEGGLHEIWSYGLDGSEPRQVLASGPRRENYMSAERSPDSRYVYYAQRRGSFSWDPKPPIWYVLRRDTTTGESDILVNRPGSAFSPRLSHDGRLLVYGTRVDGETGLRLRDLETGVERWLKYPVQRDDQESRASRDVLPGYSFTADDREIVVSYGGKIHRVSVADGTATEVPFEADVSVPLAPRVHVRTPIEDGPVRAHLVQWPELSPDGERLVFSALGHLYEVDPEGGEPRRITDGDTFEFQPTWSPDGSRIAYATWSPDGGHLWTLSMDGETGPERVTEVAGHYQDPAWTPDGSRLVAIFTATQARQEMLDGLSTPHPKEIVWVSSEGGPLHRLGFADGAQRPHFADDPERIYLSTGYGLQAMDFEGNTSGILLQAQGQGLQGPESRAPATGVVISPDGRHALTLVNKQLYVVEVWQPEDAPADESAEDPASEPEETQPEETQVVEVATLEVLPRDSEPSSSDDPPPESAETAETDDPPPESAEPDETDETDETDEEEPTTAVRRVSDLGADDYSWGEGGKTIVWSLGSTVFRKSLASAWTTDELEAWSLGAEETEIVVEVPRDKPTGTLALVGARLITMDGDRVIENGTLVIRDHRIVAVGPRDQVEVPAEAKILELDGKTVVPGFIDIHAHWHELMIGHVDRQAWPLWVSLAHGLTTTRDPQSRTLDLFLYKDLVDSGEILGPRLYTTGPGWFANTPIASYEDAERMALRFKKHYRTSMIKAYTTGDRHVRQWVARAGREVGLMATTEGAMDLKLNLTHVLDGFSGNEHNLPVAPIYDDVVQLFAQSQIYYTPTLVLSYGGPLGENFFYAHTNVHDDPKIRRFVPHGLLDSRALRRSWYHPREHIFPRHARTAAAIAAAGGKVCLGGHGQMQGIQAHWEMWALASGGMPALEVLRSATLNGAEAIGLDRDLGSLEEGKLADLVILDRDPLEDIRHTLAIDSVMKNGRLYDGDDLDQLWPTPRSLPDPWWWRDDPTRDSSAPSRDSHSHDLTSDAESLGGTDDLARGLYRPWLALPTQEGAPDD